MEICQIEMLPLANGIWRGTVEAATPEACAFSVVLLPIRLFSPVTGFLVIGSLFALMIPGLLLGVLASFGRDTWALANLLVRFPDLTLEELHSEINAILERHLLGTADIFHLFLLLRLFQHTEYSASIRLSQLETRYCQFPPSRKFCEGSGV